MTDTSPTLGLQASFGKITDIFQPRYLEYHYPYDCVLSHCSQGPVGTVCNSSGCQEKLLTRSSEILQQLNEACDQRATLISQYIGLKSEIDATWGNVFE